MITLSEISKRYSALEVAEQRSATDTYSELVFYSKDIDQWHKVLAETLGPPIKPAGVEPTQEDQELTRDYGGIFDGQTLFRKEFNRTTVIAMFWPWQDNEHITLKIAIL